MPDPDDTPSRSADAGESGERNDRSEPRDGSGAESGAACDYDLAEHDNQLALWQEFQRQQRAECPVTGAEITLALAHDPADDPAGQAHTEVSAHCSRCGRRSTFRPPDAAEIYGWAE